MQPAIPVEAKDELYGYWTLHHPRPDLLTLRFPEKPQFGLVGSSAWSRWIALAVYLATMAFQFTPDNWQVLLCITLSILGVVWLVSPNEMSVLELTMDGQRKTLLVREKIRDGYFLDSWTLRVREISYSEIKEITYEPQHATTRTNRPARIFVLFKSGGDPICLKHLGFHSSIDLFACLNFMLGAAHG